jgi:hypothetical protein
MLNFFLCKYLYIHKPYHQLTVKLVFICSYIFQLGIASIFRKLLYMPSYSKHRKLNLDIQSNKIWRENLQHQMLGYYGLFNFNNVTRF